MNSSAQNIHTEGDWDIIFTLLECVGAGAIPPDYEESLTLTQAYLGKKTRHSSKPPGIVHFFVIPM